MKKLKTRVNPFQFIDSEVLTVNSLSTSSCESLVERLKKAINLPLIMEKNRKEICRPYSPG